MRNPSWVRDEVILALDLYLKAGRRQLSASHPAVVRLSRLLNALPIHASEARAHNFRNPEGISMILGNFLGIDPQHGKPGLSRNSRLHVEVWRDFNDCEATLRQTAQAISRSAARPQIVERSEWSEEEFPEGRLLMRLHTSRERNRSAVERKKANVLSVEGRLACEACGFDFEKVYGELGSGFAECHHTLPLAEAASSRVTRLADLAIICANCHRMMHRSHPMKSIDELRHLLKRRQQ